MSDSAEDARLAAALTARHAAVHGRQPQLVASAPGRVNLIGEHTDYNDGLVLPMAVDLRTYVAATAVPAVPGVCVHSMQRDETVEAEATGLAAVSGWASYVCGVVALLAERLGQDGGTLPGLALTVHSTVPQAAGLSSSAALEVATGAALRALLGMSVDDQELALLAQRAEHEYAGVRCGVMDQFIVTFAQAGHALELDARSLAFQQVPLPEAAQIVVTNSNVPRGLADSAYNERRAQCEQCVAALQRLRPGVALRDYTVADLEAVAAELTPTALDRGRDVIEEIERVARSVELLRSGDLARFGALMNASHTSLRDRYAVSCPQVDWLVERAWQTAGVFGARITGAGFGGCTVSLLPEAAVAEYRRRLAGYDDRFGLQADVLTVRAADGVSCRLRPGSGA